MTMCPILSNQILYTFLKGCSSNFNLRVRLVWSLGNDKNNIQEQHTCVYLLLNRPFDSFHLDLRISQQYMCVPIILLEDYYSTPLLIPTFSFSFVSFNPPFETVCYEFRFFLLKAICCLEMVQIGKENWQKWLSSHHTLNVLVGKQEHGICRNKKGKS